jgi:peptide/nickel transport system substrate-binding protein
MPYKYRYIIHLILLAALVGCNRAGDRRALTVVHKGWPLTLAPHLKAEQITFSVQANLFEGLVEFDPQMKIRPLLAQSWENPDDLTWVFKLRPNVRFHDGSPLTADDVVFSLARAKGYQASALKADFVMVDSIVKSDSLTVKLKTRKPYPLLLNRLVNAFIVPLALMERMGDQGFAQKPVGTGPYRFESFPPGGPLTLAAFGDYWCRPPAFKRMVVLSLDDQREALRLLKTGNADIVTQLDASLAAEMRDRPTPDLDIISRPGLTLRYLGYDFGRKPFNNIKVRQAILAAVDRTSLVKDLNHGFGQPANQLVPQAVFGYNPDLPELVPDPARARRLLAEAGYTQGVDVTLTIPEVRLALGERIRDQMKPAGIRITLRVLPRDQFFQAVDTAGFFLFGVSSTSGDASDLFEDAIHSRQGGYGHTNRGGYHHPQIDHLIENASGQLEQTRRLKSLQEIMARCMEDLPRVPLYIEEEIHGVSARIVWEPRLDMMVLGKEVRPK